MSKKTTYYFLSMLLIICCTACGTLTPEPEVEISPSAIEVEAPTAETPVEENPTAETPVEENPTAEAPVEENPTAEAPTAEADSGSDVGDGGIGVDEPEVASSTPVVYIESDPAFEAPTCDIDTTNLVPVAEFEFNEVDVQDIPELNTTDFPGAITYRGEIQVNGQRFEIFVSGLDDGLIQEYIDEAAICAEAIDTGQIDSPAILYDAAVIESLLALSGAEYADVVEIHATFAFWPDDSPLAVAELADMVGVDVGVLIDEAVQHVANQPAINEPWADSAEDVIRQKVEGIVFEVGTPLFTGIVNDDIRPRSDAEYANYYQTLSENFEFLVITFAWLPLDAELESETEYAVWWTIDPSIHSDKVIEYKAKCSVSRARVRIKAVAGSMTAELWRPNFSYGFRTADAGGNPHPSAIRGGYGYTTFDAEVTGNQDSSQYTIQGGWTRGAGQCD